MRNAALADSKILRDRSLVVADAVIKTPLRFAEVY